MQRNYESPVFQVKNGFINQARHVSIGHENIYQFPTSIWQILVPPFLVLNAFCDKRKKHIDCTFEYIDSYSFAIDVDDVSSMKEQKTA